MRWASAVLLVSGVCTPLLTAAQFSGSIRAADQFVPGATVTARNGETKVSCLHRRKRALHHGPGSRCLGYTGRNVRVHSRESPVHDWVGGCHQGLGAHDAEDWGPDRIIGCGAGSVGDCSAGGSRRRPWRAGRRTTPRRLWRSGGIRWAKRSRWRCRSRAFRPAAA